MAEIEATNENRSVRTKLTLKDLGEPGSIKALPDDIKTYSLGRLIGICRDTLSRTDDKTGEKYEGLKGEFRSIPSDPEKAKGRVELESSILYIPDAFHSMITQQLTAAQKIDPSAEVIFVFDVTAIRASNPAGYSWDFKPVLGKAENRLDALASEVTKQLGGPAKAPQIADTAKAASGGKK